jgi:type IV pilus assembly protein PilO
MFEQLKQLQPRVLFLILFAAIALTATAAYLYVLKKPLAEYRRLRQTRTLLEVEVANGAQNSLEVARLTAEVEALERRLRSGGEAVPVNQMVAHIIDQLDRISGHHTVQLVGVRPGESKEVFMFEEVPFDVEITGGYFSLYDWLREVELELGPMVVKQFDIAPEQKTENTRMRLTMVSYRSVGQEL